MGMQRVIKFPVDTSKTKYLTENYNQYVFEVTPSATKPQISAWMEKLFLVPVIRVNTHCQSHSSRRNRSAIKISSKRSKLSYKRSIRKRAIVTLRKQEKLVFFPQTLLLFV